ncbi:hypothetical protein JCM3765_000505 [Sporobolomyces pararoseus]
MPSKQGFETKDGAVFTDSQGHSIQEPYAVQRAGRQGPLLLQDFNLIDALAHFDRERIPERVVHAKGGGAHGTFEVTHDISDLTCAQLFQKVGTKVKATARFSTVGGESGSADTARDPRGFSVKLRTEDGIWDHVYNNTPVFFLRDAMKFPYFIHTQKRDPQTHLKDPDHFWDYASQNPESFHQFTILFSDRGGTPYGYRFMNGYSGHTHKLVKEDGSFVYVQFHYKSDQGIKAFTNEEAGKMAGENPDFSNQDLFEAIEKGDFPSWTLYIQVMTPEQAEKFRYNILDLTKTWPQKEYPLRPVGKLTLNENVQNYFAEIEQIAFSPSHLPKGIEPSADPVLQSRLFSYPDTHRYRLGANYAQLPVNAPINPIANFQRDGKMAFGNNQGLRPNYVSSLSPLTYKKEPYDVATHEQFLGGAILDLSEVTELDFEQPRDLYKRVFSDTDREHFVSNVSGHLGGAKSEEVKKRVLSCFACIDQELSNKIAKEIGLPEQQPLQVKPASEAIRFQPKIGGSSSSKL